MKRVVQFVTGLVMAVRRRPVRSVVVLTPVLVVVLFFLLTPLHPHPYEQFYHRVHLGMSFQDVEEVIPLPPGVSCTDQVLMVLERWAPWGPVRESGTPLEHHDACLGAREGEWRLVNKQEEQVGTRLLWADESYRYFLRLEFDRGERVVYKCFGYINRRDWGEPGLVRRVLDWVTTNTGW